MRISGFLLSLAMMPLALVALERSAAAQSPLIQVANNTTISAGADLPIFWVICSSSHAPGWIVEWGRCRIIEPNGTQHNHAPCTFDGIDQFSWGLAYPSTTGKTGTWKYEFSTYETDGMNHQFFVRETVNIIVN